MISEIKTSSSLELEEEKSTEFSERLAKVKKRLTDMECHHSPFEDALRALDIDVAKVFLRNDEVCPVEFANSERKLETSIDVENAFPKIIKESQNYVLNGQSTTDCISGKRVAVLFSGGPAAGGHNVVAGIKKVLGEHNTLFGIKAGPKGLLNGDLFELNDEVIKEVFNLGGFDLLGSDRTKITTEEQYKQVRKTVKDYNLDGIIIIGGDDSNTNAAFLAEYLYLDKCSVIGVPKTIDGDLQIGDLLPISFGFDTATKIYAELIGNILQDTPSSRKYWHFIKLMGRSASHVALEVGLKTRPQICLISEEVAEKKMTLNDIVEYIAGVIAYRAGKGLNYGVVVIPEGIIEFIPECRVLIEELNESLAEVDEDLKGMSFTQKLALIKLTKESAKLLASLPESVENKLFLDRDSHGNLQVSQIPTEQLLIEMTERKIKEMKADPHKYFGTGKIELSDDEIAKFYRFKFQTNNHFFGYEGRCGAPSRFDAAYTYNLGLVAGSLAMQNKTGYMASIMNLDKGGTPIAIPLTGLINTERRHGKDEMVIKKALVELDSPAFEFFKERRDTWSQINSFTSPGPRQIWGPSSKQVPYSVALNRSFSNLDYNIG